MAFLVRFGALLVLTAKTTKNTPKALKRGSTNSAPTTSSIRALVLVLVPCVLVPALLVISGAGTTSIRLVLVPASMY